MITGFYAGLMGLMMMVLILRVALRRRKYKVGLGDGGIADLGQAIRVHGNFSEMVPMMLIVLGLLEINQIPPLYLHIFGALLVLTRLLHAHGITSSPNLSFGRKTGIILSLFLLLLGSVTLIINYVTN